MDEDESAPGRRRLREALVEVVDALVAWPGTPSQLDEWATIASGYAQQVAATPPGTVLFGLGPRGLMAVNGVAAAATLEHEAFEQGSVSGVCTFGPAHEGHAGQAHGGAIAATFDELFGLLWAYALIPRYTRTLSVSYLRPLPLGVAVAFEARATALPNGRTRLRATATLDGRVSARASALMVARGPRA